jgi:glycosyltransferase involved in cell wall biosynthesis
MKGWDECGASVLFMVNYIGAIESHEYVTLHKMCPSILTRLVHKIIDEKCNVVEAENKKSHVFRPDFFDILKQLMMFRPDFVVLRNFSLGNLKLILICRLLGINRIIIYVQDPIYGLPPNSNRLKNFIRKTCFTTAVFSPVFYNGEYRKKDILSGRAKYFVPLVCDTPKNLRTVFCPNGKIRILDVGKYRDYKNHFFVVDALSKVNNPNDFEVTIIGQLTNDCEKDYYNSLKKYIEEKQLDHIVKLYGNVGYNKMDDVYSQHDVLLLASKNETAGMVILEAMSHGLCVISSINCGLTSYIDENECGLSFSIKNVSFLVEKLNTIAENKFLVSQLGQKAQKVTIDEFCFDRYRDKLNDLMREEYDYSIMPAKINVL